MSTDESAPTKLPDKAEALLANWELVDRDWEASAAVIESRLSDITPGSTDAALLEAPLPREADEGEIVTGVPVSAPAPIAEGAQPIAPTPVVEVAQADEAAAEAPAAEAPAAEAPAARAEAPAVQAVPTPAPAPTAKPQSLADMARASVNRSSAQKEAADLAKETFAVASMRRGPSAEVVERVQAAAARKPVPSNPALDDTSPRTSGVIKRTAPKSKPNMAPIYGAGVALLGIAAAVALFMRGGSAPEQQAVTQAEPAAKVEAAPMQANPPPPAPTAVAQADSPPPASPEPTPAPAGPNDEAAPAAKAAVAEPTAAVAKKGAAAAGGPAAAPAPPPSTGAGPSPEKIVLEEDGPVPPGSAPGAKAEPPMRPADGSGSIPQKPSIGAVSAAIGAVMGGARSCLAGQKDVSLAQVVFSSDGSVQSVVVNGPAAGTPTAACIEGALRKARLQPFAVPTFSTGVTIRPP